MNIHRESEYTIYCNDCGATESIYSSDSEYRHDDTPTRYFKRQGWKDISGKTLCKDCGEKVNK